MLVNELRMISSMATRELLADLVALFTKANGVVVQVHSAGGVDVARRIAAGEDFDVVVLASNTIDQLITDGAVSAGSRVDLVKSGIAIAVRAGHPPWVPDSEETVKQAVLAASSLGFSTGPSGTYLVELFKRWGIYDTLKPRIVQAPPGVPVGTLLARGEVEVGFQQLSELLHLPGITVLGPLPAAIQLITVFAAGLTPAARHKPTAQALVDFMASAAATPAKRRQGMEPAEAGRW